MFAITKESLVENEANAKENRTKSLKYKYMSSNIVSGLELITPRFFQQKNLSLFFSLSPLPRQLSCSWRFSTNVTNLLTNKIKILSHRWQGWEVVEIHHWNVFVIHSKIYHTYTYITDRFFFFYVIIRATKNILYNH